MKNIAGDNCQPLIEGLRAVCKTKRGVGDNRTNFTGTKGGFRLSNWPLRDVAFTAEYTFTYPKTYQYLTPVTTFETNNFNLGHYLRDNSRELYIALQVKPVKALSLDLSYLKAGKGNVVPYVYNAPTPVDQVGCYAYLVEEALFVDDEPAEVYVVAECHGVIAAVGVVEQQIVVF